MNQLEITPNFNHIAIQTDDVDSTIWWYERFVGATVEWSLDTFSPLTNARLPGIKKLVELKAGDRAVSCLRPGRAQPGRPASARFSVPARRRHRRAARPARGAARALAGSCVSRPTSGGTTTSRPSDIVSDPDGMQSLYVLDPNGLEFEFICFAGDDA